MLYFSPCCNFLVCFIFGNGTLGLNKNKEKDPAANLMKFYLQFDVAFRNNLYNYYVMND